MEEDRDEFLLKETQAKLLQDAMACLSVEELRAVTNAIHGAATMNRLVMQMQQIQQMGERA